MTVGKSLWNILCLTAIILNAKELDFDGTFSKRDDKGDSATWLAPPWPAYQPPPKLKLHRHKNSHTVLAVRQITAKEGTEIITPCRHPAKSGDILHISFKLRGKGKATFRINNFTAQGGWNKPSQWHQDMDLSSKWTTYMYQCELPDIFTLKSN